MFQWTNTSHQVCSKDTRITSKGVITDFRQVFTNSTKSFFWLSYFNSKSKQHLWLKNDCNSNPTLQNQHEQWQIQKRENFEDIRVKSEKSAKQSSIFQPRYLSTLCCISEKKIFRHTDLSEDNDVYINCSLATRHKCLIRTKMFSFNFCRTKKAFFKGFLRYKTITSQNVSSEAQIKNFFIS